MDKATMNGFAKNRSGPMRVAHRGARNEAPENTLSAFRQALKYPIAGIEFDVQMSKDGMLVIHHDETLHTLTGGSQRMADVDWNFLKQLDWGRWFNKSFSGEPPATLEGVLNEFGGRTRLYIEIKSFLTDHQSGHTHRMVDSTMTMLAKTMPQLNPKLVAILSFDPEIIMRAFHQAGEWRYIYNVPEENPNAVMEMPPHFLDILWAIDIEISRLSTGLVEWAQARGLEVMTYTCNTAEQVQKALTMACSAILSDNPGWLTRYLAG